MGILDFISDLILKFRSNVYSKDKSETADEYIEVKSLNEYYEKKGYWREVYSPKDRIYISRHGTDEEFENYSNESDKDSDFSIIKINHEDYENINPIFEKDYSDFHNN